MKQTQALTLKTTVFSVVSAIFASSPALADEAPPPVAAKPPPYSLAWNLRPVAPGNVVRSDTAVGMFSDAGTGGSTVASTFLASYKVTPTLAPLLRIAVVHNDPAMGESATAVSNPLLGAIWAPPGLSAPFKAGVFAAVAIPLGSGGGNDGDPVMVSTNRSAMAARSNMDNALFAVNDLTPILGADVAYVANGLTVQVEATVLELIRVRGAEKQPDAYKTNFTSGIHAGYFVMPWLSLGAELRYQRYLSTPSFVAATPTNRDNLSVAAGLRAHFDLGDKRWLRPGIAYARGLDDPMTGAGYSVVQVDVPFAF